MFFKIWKHPEALLLSFHSREVCEENQKLEVAKSDE